MIISFAIFKINAGTEVNHPGLKSRACISDLADNAKSVVIAL